jgi:hypothetical protein
MTPTDSPATTTLYELRFDNDEYFLPLGLFGSMAEATAAWELLKPKLNDDYADSWQIAPATLHHAPPDSDVIEGWLAEMLDHNEDVLAYEKEDEDEEPPADEEGESYHPLEEPSPGQVDLPLT